MNNKIVVTKAILDLYYKHDEDFNLLGEPWANNKDRELFNNHHTGADILTSYIDLLHFSKVENLSTDLRKKTINEIQNFENYIEKEVIEILKK